MDGLSEEMRHPLDGVTVVSLEQSVAAPLTAIIDDAIADRSADEVSAVRRDTAAGQGR